jgi:hypothetical protein
MIYCVIPQELAGEIYDSMHAHYARDPAVEVIVDRRAGDRRAGEVEPPRERRSRRDRRRPRVPGEFAATV